MDELKKLRKEIDSVDQKIVELLGERGKIALNIGKIKSSNNKTYYNPARESEVYKNIISYNEGPLKDEHLQNIFREIISACITVQSGIRISYFGPEGTFTHLAAIKRFGTSRMLIPVKTIADVFSSVSKGLSEYGVVPVENTIEGMVNATFDMFVNSDVTIIGEEVIPISHFLFSKEEDIKKIKKIYSHPQPFGQCRNFLEENFKDAELIDAFSTADACIMASKEAGAAAIASEVAGRIYGLNVLLPHIEDFSNNFTRFLIISSGEKTHKTGRDKTSILFSIKNSVGALYKILKPFFENEINITKIESRPSKKFNWDYLFFIDVGCHESDEKLKKALKLIEEYTIFIKILGSYESASKTI
ncbi:MAG: prephenate dehydratase [bacterium]